MPPATIWRGEVEVRSRELEELPKRLQLRVKAALREVMYSETRAKVREAVTRFAVEYGPTYPEASRDACS